VRGGAQTGRRARMRRELERARRPALVTLLAAVLAVAAFGVLLGRMNVELPWQDRLTVRVAVDDAKSVIPGRNEVRWAGVVVGRITAVDLHDGRPVLTASIDAGKGGGPLHRDATLRLRPQTALNDMYLDIERSGTPAAGRVSDGEVLDAARTRTPVDIAEVLGTFDEDTALRFSSLLDELGRGLPDGGAQLRSAFSAAVPWLREQRRVASVLTERKGLVSRLVRNTRLLTDELARRDDDLARLVDSGAGTFEETAASREAIDGFLRELPPTMTRLRGSFAELRTTLAVARPALAALRPAARALPAGLGALEEFATTARPALRALRSPVADLVPLARDLAPTAIALDRALHRTAPQVPRVDRITEKVTRCELPLQKFFAWTMSTMKLGNASNRSASPRGTLVVSAADGATQAAPDPNLRGAIGCADGRPPK
jgi:virulence factor Mce-like protein